MVENFNKYESYQGPKNNDPIEALKNISSESPIIGIFFIMGIILFLFSGINELNFRLRYIMPPSYTLTSKQIDITQEPIQTEPSSALPFIFNSENFEKYNFIPMADYSISAIVVAKNTNLWLRGVMNSKFDDVALIDLGLLCGKVANEETLKYVRFQSKKTLGSARSLRPMPAHFKSYRDVNNYLVDKNLSLDYLFTHMSHVHIIPANRNIMSALIRLNRKNTVRLDGYLVDIEYNRPLVRTSLSRNDTNQTARGGGACEVMYVSKVQIGNKIYQ